MDKDIFIVRHGRTEYNKLGIWQGSSVDAPLDEVGKQQADAFFESYKDEGFDLIVYSELKRTKQTIQKFLDLGTAEFMTSDINEISWGLHEGKPHTEASLAEYHEVVRQWKKENYDVSLEGGESASDIGARLMNFVTWLRSLKKKKVLICTHGRAIRGLLCILQNEPLKNMEKYRHANTGLFILTYRDAIFTVKEMNNTSHILE